ncbi:hypothetical protein, partial [Secundilactobacillus kimchicus]|uniref:hypothetical protein n=1 Tax=Secundilactobacillus kimchicus TaxID=528209 RepID=UPI0024A87EB0
MERAFLFVIKLAVCPRDRRLFLGGSVGMTIHVGNIDDGTVEEFLNTIDIERLLNKFGIIEA